MKSVLIIGMGRMGRHLAKKMMELGNDVMIVDDDEALIDELAPDFTNAMVGDCRNEAVLRSIGVTHFDVCFVAIGENFQSSLETTALLKELGAKYIVSKSNSDRQKKFLKMAGADEVVYPERDIAEKLAIRFTADNIFDYIEITPEFAIYEIPVPKPWVGRTIIDVHVRHNHKINILAVKNAHDLKPMPGADYQFDEDDHMIVLGKEADVMKLSAIK